MSLNANSSFNESTRLSFRDFADSHVVIPMGLVTPIPAHGPQGMTMLESKDDDRGVNEASLFLGLGFKKTLGTFKLLFSYMTEELTVIRPQETGK